MSGKTARKLRKNQKVSKKTIALCVGMCLSAAPIIADGEFLVSVYPHLTKPFGNSHGIQYGMGAGLKVAYRPIDFLNLFVQGDYLNLALPKVDSITLLNGAVGAGYHLPLNDRMALDFNVDAGIYQAKSSKKLNGISGGAQVTFTYKLNPIIYTDVSVSASHYASESVPLMPLNAAISPGVTLNLTQIFKRNERVQFEEKELAPVFPVLYSWYENNSFGKVEIKNEEDATITDITVSFYQPQYMAHPKECAKIDSIQKKESAEVDLYAFFNETMLELTEKTDTQSSVIVEYSYLGQKRTKAFSMVVPVYGRNNMSWDDDRRAAVFVSSKDPAAMLFAKYVTSVVHDNVRSGVPLNIQYAMGIFEVLDQFGLNYVVDPSSAFEDNVGSSSIDFLQFPYQTLMYRGGDCDDLSILVSSLFEAIGIRTAFITIPGHIFMAFDSGLNVKQAQSEFSSLRELIVVDDEVWVPLEITLTDEGFNKAWRVGAREWNTANNAGVAALFKMEDSWKIYQPISVHGANSYFTMPDEEIVSKLFDHSVDQWIAREIEPQIQMYQAKLAKHDDVKTRNNLGVLYGKYGLFVQADNEFKQARRQGYVPSIINTGNIYFSRQNYELARKWYKSVLKNEPNNTLALIGIARCSYELTDYDECDAAYAKVMELDPELAGEYSYLGSFVYNKGRAFSLADRLTNTIWLEEKEAVPEKMKQTVKKQDASKKEAVLDEADQLMVDDIFDFSIDGVAIVPETGKEEEEETLEELEAESELEGGDGKKDPFAEELQEEEPTVEIAELDMSVFAENFNGLVSEIELQNVELEPIPADAVAKAPVKKPAAVEEKITEIEKPVSVKKTVVEKKVEPAAVEQPVVAVVEPAVVETPAVAAAEPAAVEQPVAAVVEPAAVETPKIAAAEPAAAETPAVAAVEPAAVEQPVAEVVEPAVVETPVVAVVEPAATETPKVAAVEPAVVEQPVAEVVEPAVVETPVVAVVEPAATETPKVAAVEPAVVETPAVAVVEPAAVEQPVVAVVEPAVVETPVVAVVESAVVETPVVAAAEPAVVETPAVVAAEPAAAETPAVAAVEPAAVETPKIAAAEPAAVETPKVAAVEPAAVETPKIAAAEPAAVETPKVAAVEPAAAETPAVAAAEPVAVETPKIAAVKPAAVEQPVAEVVESAVVETPAVAAVEPAAVETPAVAAVKPAAVETPKVAAVEPAAAETPAVAAAEPVAVETPAVAAVEPAAAETPSTAVVEPQQEEFFEEEFEEIIEEEFDLDDYLNEIAAADEVINSLETSAIPEISEKVDEEEKIAESTESTENTEDKIVEVADSEYAQKETSVESEEDETFEQIAVPRFTEQPSAEWAPEVAYTATFIPGMKTYEEEMGEYQNDKAFLYEDKVELNIDPDHDYDEKKDDKQSDMYAMAGLPDVDPFSSYLSEEDAKIVRKITNYSIEEVKKQAMLAAKEEDAEKISSVEMPAVAEKTEIKEEAIEEILEENNTSEQKKSTKGLPIAILGAIGAALIGLFAAKKSKVKKGEEK